MDTLANPFSLEGKSILVTGATSGIGRAVASACAQMGARVHVTGRNVSRLEETASVLGCRAGCAIPADLDNPQNVECLAEQLPALNGIVHCAGIAGRTPCKNITIPELDSAFKTNLYAPVLLQAALLRQKKVCKGASIVLLASRAAASPSVGNAVYSATKGALISYAKCLALELAPRRVRVNCICPGMVWTPMITGGEIDTAHLEEAQSLYPLKRYGKPEDIAYLAVYLLSEASAWMTGSCIDISGGGEGVLT